MNLDNDKTFKAASNMLKALFKLPQVRGHLANRGVKWTFNLDSALWWGNYFEQLVQGMKQCLKKILKNARVSFKQY